MFHSYFESEKQFNLASLVFVRDEVERSFLESTWKPY